MRYKVLGWAVWKGGRWYLGRRHVPLPKSATPIYRPLGWTTWTGGRLYVRRKYGGRVRPAAIALAVVVVAVVALVAGVLIARRGGGEEATAA
jgi:hypothetical protein